MVGGGPVIVSVKRSSPTNGAGRSDVARLRRPGRLERGDGRLVLVGTRRLCLHPARIVRQPVESPGPSDRWAVNWPPRTRLTPEERERVLRLIEDLKASHVQAMAERNGQPCSPPAWQLINEARDERSRQLG